jgi:hypothetical protein
VARFPFPPHGRIPNFEGLAKKAESVIYPNSPRLTGLNSHPINADSYLIGWRGLLAVLERGFRVCALLP